MTHERIEQLTVRAIQADDALALFTLVDRDRVRFSLYFPVSTSRTSDPGSAAIYVRELLAQAHAKEAFSFLVFADETPAPVGAVFLKSFDHRVGKCELAYFTASAFQCRGVASNAVAWAVDEAFRTHAMQRLFMRIDPENAGSIRVAEKNGFEREGLMRRDFRTSDGRLLDVIVFAKLREA